MPSLKSCVYSRTVSISTLCCATRQQQRYELTLPTAGVKYYRSSAWKMCSPGIYPNADFCSTLLKSVAFQALEGKHLLLTWYKLPRERKVEQNWASQNTGIESQLPVLCRVWRAQPVGGPQPAILLSAWPYATNLTVLNASFEPNSSHFNPANIYSSIIRYTKSPVKILFARVLKIRSKAHCIVVAVASTLWTHPNNLK